jgi:hypothetical protein
MKGSVQRVVVAYFNVLSWYLAAETEDNAKYHRSVYNYENPVILFKHFQANTGVPVRQPLPHHGRSSEAVVKRNTYTHRHRGDIRFLLII